MIRVIAKDGIEPTNDIEGTQNNVYYDPVCLKSQYAARSKNQLVSKPLEGTTVTTSHRVSLKYITTCNTSS